MWCTSRQVRNKLVERTPSPWLGAFASDKSQDSVDPPSEVVELLERLNQASSHHESDDRATKILRELQLWRTAAARTARITPAAVLRDSTLRAIVEQEPTTISELATIIGPNKAHRFGPRLLEIIHPPT